MASQDGGTDAWAGGDDGESLFEGMVLFTPSLSADPAVEAPEPPKPATPRPDAVADSDSNAASQPPPPLDEDLFSDLTLLAPQPPQGQDQNHAAADLPPAPAPPSTAALTRQPSSSGFSSLRKKKRAVRIGYGRSPQPVSAPPPTVSITTTTATIGTVIPTTSSILPDASLHPAAHPTHGQYLEQLGNGDGDELDVVVVDPNGNSLHVKEEVKEEDGEVEVDGGAGVAPVGIEERLALLRSQISGKLESIQQPPKPRGIALIWA